MRRLLRLSGLDGELNVEEEEEEEEEQPTGQGRSSAAWPSSSRTGSGSSRWTKSASGGF